MSNQNSNNIGDDKKNPSSSTSSSSTVSEITTTMESLPSATTMNTSDNGSFMTYVPLIGSLFGSQRSQSSLSVSQKQQQSNVISPNSLKMVGNGDTELPSKENGKIPLNNNNYRLDLNNDVQRSIINIILKIIKENFYSNPVTKVKHVSAVSSNPIDNKPKHLTSHTFSLYNLVTFLQQDKDFLTFGISWVSNFFVKQKNYNLILCHPTYNVLL